MYELCVCRAISTSPIHSVALARNRSPPTVDPSSAICRSDPVNCHPVELTPVLASELNVDVDVDVDVAYAQ